jgi:hypothetical protein
MTVRQPPVPASPSVIVTNSSYSIRVYAVVAQIIVKASRNESMGYDGAGQGAWTRCEGSQPAEAWPLPAVTSQLRRCCCVKRGRGLAGPEQTTTTAAGRITLTVL